MAYLPGDILEFKQLEESIGVAWARFIHLCASRPSSFLPNDVLLYAFFMGLEMDVTQDLDIVAGGSFAYKTLVEGRAILNSLLENYSLPTDHNEPHQESDSIHESLSIAELEPFDFHISIFDRGALSRTRNSGGRRNSASRVPLSIRG
jgi:hypothetical protein